MREKSRFLASLLELDTLYLDPWEHPKDGLAANLPESLDRRGLFIANIL